MERNMRDPQQVRTQNAQQPLPEQAVILAAQEAARTRANQQAQAARDTSAEAALLAARAHELLQKYRAGKASLDARVVENDQWYRLRNWEHINRSENPGDPEPVSAWLLNCLANKHADAMDNYPEPVVLPREAGDQADAQILSAVLPVILEQCGFEQTYSDMWWRKLKSGTGVLGAFWNPAKNGGLGDVDIRCIDILNLFWEPGVTDIQDSQGVFHVELRDNDNLLRQYPQLEGRLSTPTAEIAQYVHDDTIDTAGKSAVVDWYYKRGSVLHYAKIVNDVVLYSSEGDAEYAQRGFYDHGKYPFVFDTLFPCEGAPAGFGYLDVCKDAQIYIDKLDQVILKNAIMAGRPRWFVRQDGIVNEQEYADWTRDFVHYQGTGNPEEHIRPIEVAPLDGSVITVRNNKIDEMKETSGNRDFSQGGTTSGVTAASAIAALQEAGSKLSRDMIKSSYRAFQQVCYLVLELIRQFYDEPRSFRIVGEQGAIQYIQYSNARIRQQAPGMEFGMQIPGRVPVFDLQIRAQKSNAFSTLAQNELAKEFYGLGFFNPQLSDQALACLEMMTFDGKDRVVQRITQNGTLYQQILVMQQQMAQMAAIIDAQNGTNLSGARGGDQSAREQTNPPSDAQGAGGAVQTNPLGGVAANQSGLSTAAQRRAQNSAAPRG